ncbi:MAG: DUF3592 domain-containing protein [Oscillospiraceae bacterium]|nr:DUF3592 domain-containing protein [Oscillospiraceae bacterium]
MAKSKKKIHPGVLIFLILFTAFPFIVGGALIIYNQVYMSKAESTEAVVTFVQERRDVMRLFTTRKIPHIKISIKYTVDGVDYHDVWSDKIRNAATMKIGDTFPVYYQPGKPEKAATGHDLMGAGIAFIVWGFVQPVVILVVGLLGVKKKKKKK